MRIHGDDRRLFYGDLFPTAGDLNVTRVYPGTISGWHRHEKQTDYFFLVAGKLKVGVWNGKHLDAPDFITLDAHNPYVLEIPPGTWHGYANLWPEDAVYVMYATAKWDGTDEARKLTEAHEWAVKLK